MLFNGSSVCSGVLVFALRLLCFLWEEVKKGREGKAVWKGLDLRELVRGQCLRCLMLNSPDVKIPSNFNDLAFVPFEGFKQRLDKKTAVQNLKSVLQQKPFFSLVFPMLNICNKIAQMPLHNLLYKTPAQWTIENNDAQKPEISAHNNDEYHDQQIICLLSIPMLISLCGCGSKKVDPPPKKIKW